MKTSCSAECIKAFKCCQKLSIGGVMFVSNFIWSEDLLDSPENLRVKRGLYVGSSIS